MTKKWLGSKPERCEVCGDGFRDMFFDARVGGHRGTAWALVCGDCFNAYQCLLGTGLGQAYNLETLERIEVPNVREAKPPRRCHGCGRELDRHAPERVVFCGRCGDPGVAVVLRLGNGTCERCGAENVTLYTKQPSDRYEELCRHCFEGGAL